MAVSGDIIEVTWNHPTLGSGTLYPKAGEASTYDLGGFRSSDEAQGIAGNGQMIDQMTQSRPFFEVPVVWDMNTGGELEACTAMAGHPVKADWTFTHINGTVYGGKGKPVGDLQGDGGAATFTLKVAGDNKFRKIA